MRRTRSNRDLTHAPLTKWLVAHGWHVTDVSMVPNYVDAICVQGRTVHVEFKTGKRKPKPHQEALHQEIRRAGGEVAVVASEADCQAYFERPFSGWYDEKQMRKPAC